MKSRCRLPVLLTMATLTLARQSWDEEPLQDVARCLEHLLTIIIRTVEGSTKGQVLLATHCFCLLRLPTACF